MTASSKTKGVTCPTHVGKSLLHSINKRNGGKCNSQSHRSPPEMSQGWDPVTKSRAYLELSLVKLGHGSSILSHRRRESSQKF